MKCVGCLVLTIVLAAGCAGGGNERLSKSAYEAKLQAALRSSFRGSQGPLRDLASAPGQLDRIATAFAGVATALAHVAAPADAQPLNRHLVHGATTTASALHALSAKVKAAPDLTARERLLAGFDALHIPGLDEFDHAATALAAKGYRLSWTAGT